MALTVEQERALGYARKRGTEAPAGEVRGRLAATFGEIEALLAAVPAELAGRRPAPGSWSVHEVTDHLVASHRPAAEQLAGLLEGRSSATPVPAGLLSAEPFANRWPRPLAELGRVHADLLALLARATDETGLAATAAVEMVVRPDGGGAPVHWVEAFDWKAFAILLHAHTREHAAQVRRVLAALGADWRDPGVQR